MVMAEISTRAQPAADGWHGIVRTKRKNTSTPYNVPVDAEMGSSKDRFAKPGHSGRTDRKLR